jgi:hypothetical protein
MSLSLRRGRAWTRHLLLFGVALAGVAWLAFAQPIVDRGGTIFDPAWYFSANIGLALLIFLASVSHRLDQLYYQREVPRRLNNWTHIIASTPDE